MRDWQSVGGFGIVKFWQLEWFNQIISFIAPIQVGIHFLNRQFYTFELFTIVETRTLTVFALNNV